MKIRPLGVELFHPNRWTDGRADEQTERHDEAHSTILVRFQSKENFIGRFSTNNQI